MSTRVVAVAYINNGEVVKVSVHNNLTAHIMDQHQWKENYETAKTGYMTQVCTQAALI